MTDPIAALIDRHHEDLRRLARGLLRRERTGHTLDTSGLVSEAYLRLTADSALNEPDRIRFFQMAVTAMRRILVDHARARLRIKRGGSTVSVPIEEIETELTSEEADHLVVLDEALERLARVSQRSAEVVNYRFFGGFSLEETAALLNVSSKTVQRDWLAARAWLRKEVAAELGLPA